MHFNGRLDNRPISSLTLTLQWDFSCSDHLCHRSVWHSETFPGLPEDSCDKAPSTQRFPPTRHDSLTRAVTISSMLSRKLLRCWVKGRCGEVTWATTAAASARVASEWLSSVRMSAKHRTPSTCRVREGTARVSWENTTAHDGNETENQRPLMAQPWIPSDSGGLFFSSSRDQQAPMGFLDSRPHANHPGGRPWSSTTATLIEETVT